MNVANTPTLLLSALLGVGTLSACQEQTTTTTTSAAATSAVTASEATASAAATEDASAATASGAAASVPTVTEPGSVPDGYAALEPLSQEPVRAFDGPPARALQQGTDYYALLDTSRGQVLIDLLEEDAPVTVNNFVALARNHFYDGTRFHRVIDGFMAQGGDPLSVDEAKKEEWGSGGPGYQFPDEIRQNLTFGEPNLLAMANSGPGTNGSQFFVTFAPTEFLNGRHTIFGKVVDGQSALDGLTRTATSDGGETPIEGAVPDTLLSVRILTKSQ